MSDSDATYSVFMTGAGKDKVALIKALQAVAGLQLKQAKDMVEAIPCLVQGNLSLDYAQSLAMSLQMAGASTDIRGGA